MIRTIIGILSAICVSLSLAPEMAAQGTLQDRFRILLPSDARIIETANLRVPGGKARTLVLWMSNPRPIMASWDSGPDFVYGDHWFGPTSLSLIDPANRKLINTIGIHSLNEARGNDGGFSVPFFTWDGPYYVPHPDKNHKGTPLLLYLRDLTGEGVAGQFALFEYLASGISSGSVFGYNATSDRAVQYPIESTEGSFRPVMQSWEAQVFATKPLSPGYWKFTWEPGHGSFEWIDETVRFDSVRQLFVEKRTIRPYPGFAQTHCDLKIESAPDLLNVVGQVAPDFNDEQIREILGVMDETRPNIIGNTSVVLMFHGEQIELRVKWLISGEKKIGIEFTAESNLIAAIQIQANAWCHAE